MIPRKRKLRTRSFPRSKRVHRRRVNFRVKIKRRTRARDAPALTFQNDNRWEYVRRPASRRVKKRAIKFSRRVQRVIESTLPMQIYRFSQTYDVTTYGGYAQYFSVPLYSGGSQAPSGASLNNDYNHLMQIFNNYFYSGGTAQATSISTYGNTRAIFQSASCDINLVNTSTASTGVSGNVYITVYHCECRRDTMCTPEYLFFFGNRKLQAGGASPNASNSALVVDNDQSVSAPSQCPVGMTPFDSPDFCRHFLIKNRRVVTLAPNQTLRLQMKDPREYVIKFSDFTFAQQGTLGTANVISFPAMRNLTEFYFFTLQGAPNSTGGSTVASISYQYQSWYRFKIPQEVYYTTFGADATQYGSTIGNNLTC